MVRKQSKTDGLSPELRKKLREVESKIDEPTQIRRIKRLQELQEKLEASHKIEKLKKIEKLIFLPQIAAIIIIFPLIMYLDGSSLRELYLPLYYPFLMLFAWLLILCIEAFAFRSLEIKHHPSPSAKYMMAKNSIKKAITVFIVAILIFGLLYSPFLTEGINDHASEDRNIDLRTGREKEIELTSKGRFGFLTMNNLTLDLELFDRDTNIDVSLHSRKTDNVIVEENLDVNNQSFYHDFPDQEFKELVLRLNSTDNSLIRFRLDAEVESDKMHTLSLVSFLYLASFAEWSAVLYPIKKKYSGIGIYE